MKEVAIFGVPRSGTSWLGQIFNSSPRVAYRYQPIFSWSFSGSLSESSTGREIAAFHQQLLETDDDFVCQKKNISGNETPRFAKEDPTHLVWKEVRYLEVIDNLVQNSSTQVIGLVRHPCGVLKSWMKAPKEFDEQWDIDEEWRYAGKKNRDEHDYYGYERWLDSVRMFEDLEAKYPDQFRTVKYESLLEEPETRVEELFRFVGLPVSDQTRTFLAESTQTPSDDPYGVYRSEKSGYEWRSELPASIIGEIAGDERFIALAEKYGWEER